MPRDDTAPNATEWLGGLFPMPARGDDEKERARPGLLLWLDAASGQLLGSEVAPAGELLGRASASLSETMAAPLDGPSGAPARVRVASDALAAALRVGHPDIDVVHAPTPELDDSLAALADELAEAQETMPTGYLDGGAEPAAVAAFFEATAALHRAAPWQVVPDEEYPIGVTVEAYGLRDAPLLVVGREEEPHGLLLFADLHDLDRYLGVDDGVGDDGVGDGGTDGGDDTASEPMPAHVALIFGEASSLGERARDEIERYGWNVADASAFPALVTADEGFALRPVRAEDYALGEALARALVELLSEGDEPEPPWSDPFAEPCTRSVEIDTVAGTVTVTLVAPYDAQDGSGEPVDAGTDVIAELAAVTAAMRDGEEPDYRRHEALRGELLRRVAASPEGRALGRHPFHVGPVSDFAVDYLGETITTLGADGLEEILFDIVPRKLSIEPSAAPDIVADLRTLYDYLWREHALPQADACLAVLDGESIERLEAALGDSDNFGMAKALFMGAIEEGFDMSTPEGVEAFLRTRTDEAPFGFGRPPHGAPPTPEESAARKARKKKRKSGRKAARKARKKNR